MIGASVTSTNDNLQVIGTSYFSATSTILGRLGLGTSNPLSKLMVIGNGVTPTEFTSFSPTAQQRSQTISVEGDGSSWFVARDNTNGTEAGFGTSLASGNPAFVGSLTANNLELRTTNLARMTIAAGGNIGIGTANPQTALDVLGIVSSTALTVKMATITSVTTSNLYVSGQSVFSSLSGLAKLTSGVLSAITDNSTDWDTAYSWGNHASAGYLTNLLGGLNGVFTNTTTTNATTTNLAVSGSFNFLGTVITNVSTWFNGLFDARIVAGGNSVFENTTSTNATTTNLNITGTLNAPMMTDYGFRLYASSSIASQLGGSSTTFPKGWSDGATITHLQCWTPSGTVGVELGNGTTWTYLEASTTANKIAKSYTFAAGDQIFWRVKNLTGTPTSTACKVFGTSK